jgi:hypothetical protein
LLCFSRDRCATEDNDIWVHRTKENLEKLYGVLQEWDPVKCPPKEKILRHEGIMFFGKVPDRIDVLTKIFDINFLQSNSRKSEFEFRGITIKVASVEDLIILKTSAGRPQDLADLVELKRIQEIKKT